MGTVVTGFSPIPAGWRVEFDGGAIVADAVIVATCSVSVPTTGSDGLGLRELARLGHTVHPVYPALTPITAAGSPFAELSGVSLGVTLSARDDAAKRAATATGGFLFTHQGYSGPSVLDVSHVVARAESPAAARLTVQWTELGIADWENALRPQGNRTVT